MKLLITIAGIVALGSTAASQAAGALASIRIETNLGIDFDTVDTLSITLDYENVTDGPLTIAGFDFLIKYDPIPLTFLGAEPGQILNDCGWEYFNTYSDTVGYIRIVGVADVNNGSSVPDCLAENPGELARLVFKTPIFEEIYNCWFFPIDFWWIDCGDNAVSGPAGDTLYVSNRVFRDANIEITQDAPLPTGYGAPDVCIYGTGGEIAPERAVDFYNGGFVMWCVEPIDPRGDVNLNGIAYEIADWVLFADYLLSGPGAFIINYEDQLTATDANADGSKGTLWDLAYLYRVIVGDAYPFPSPSRAAVGDTVFLVQDTLNKTITVNYADSLSALMFYFDNPVMITTTLPYHTVGGADSFATRIMVFPSLGGPPNPMLPTIPDGQVFEYVGGGNLIGAEAAYDGLSYLTALVSGGGASDCCVIRGDVNNSGGMPDISDIVALVNYLFMYGESNIPPCLEQANVDGLAGGGGPIDISDLVFLVEYLFNQGTQMPPCPTR